MITPDGIIKKAERKYKAVLQAYLSGDDHLFPMTFPVGKLSDRIDERRRQIDNLRQRAKEVTGQGYALEWRTINRLKLGKQTKPRRVVIETRDDYLTLIRKRTEFDRFVTDIEKIRRRFPALEDWVLANPQIVIDQCGLWDDLLAVCDYFLKHPRPNVYIRELPIPVHTKFIEQNNRILRDLLDALLPPHTIDATATTFEQRFGLKSPPQTIRLRLLEEQLDWQYGLRLDDLTLPVHQVAHLLADHVKPKTVIITENLINFLTLPSQPNSVGLFGRGFAAHLLSAVDWLNECEVIYWGDIDAHGFQILSDLRKVFPHTRSVMMDQETLDDHADFVGSGKDLRLDRLEGLTDSETILAQHILAHDLRLEQEHISHEYALIRLKQALRSV